MKLTRDQQFIHSLRNQLGIILASVEYLKIEAPDPSKDYLLHMIEDAIEKSILLMTSFSPPE